MLARQGVLLNWVLSFKMSFDILTYKGGIRIFKIIFPFVLSKLK